MGRSTHSTQAWTPMHTRPHMRPRCQLRVGCMGHQQHLWEQQGSALPWVLSLDVSVAGHQTWGLVCPWGSLRMAWAWEPS